MLSLTLCNNCNAKLLYLLTVVYYLHFSLLCVFPRVCGSLRVVVWHWSHALHRPRELPTLRQRECHRRPQPQLWNRLSVWLDLLWQIRSPWGKRTGIFLNLSVLDSSHPLSLSPSQNAVEKKVQWEGPWNLSSNTVEKKVGSKELHKDYDFQKLLMCLNNLSLSRPPNV